MIVIPDGKGNRKGSGLFGKSGKSGDDDEDPDEEDGNTMEYSSSASNPTQQIENILNYLLGIIAIFFNAKDPKEMITISQNDTHYTSIMQVITKNILG